LPTRRGSAGAPKVAFVYPNSRRELAAQVAAGTAPDSTLLGQNHIGEFGVDAWIHDPALTRQRSNRLRWNLREVVLPWEVADADVAFTGLAALFPLAARVRRRPRVAVLNYGLCTIWDRSPRPRRELLGAALRAARVVVCTSEWQEKRIQEQTGLDAERTVTVPLGIDADYFSPGAAPEREPYVLAVGKDMARDYRTFVEAVAPLGVRIEICAYARNLEDVELPSQARAHVVEPAELRDLYAGAACVVVPQRRQEYPWGSEGGGTTALLEAMAMARPVVATDRPGLHDYAADGRTVRFVPPEDPAALREAVEAAMGDEQLGAAAREHVMQGLTTRHMAQRLAPVLVAAAG
jgi:glycosyltransferase involved in cell wall biosynthesis